MMSPSNHLVGPDPVRTSLGTLCQHLFEGSGSIESGDGTHRAERPWLHFRVGGRTRAYHRSQVAARAARWAAGLDAIGVEPGDRVALIMPSSLDFVAGLFGAQRIGAIPVPLPWPFFLDRVDHHLRKLGGIITKAEPSAILTTPHFAESGELGLPCLTEPGPDPYRGSDLSRPEQPAFIQYTSGTTSSPKGAVISHRSAVSNVLAMGRALGLGPGEVGVSWLPLFHDMGLVGALFSSLAFDFPLHLMGPSEFMLHPKGWLRAISEARATLTVAPNFGYAHALRRVRELDGLDLGSLRTALDGSEPVTRKIVDAFEARFREAGLTVGTIRPVYGLAENTLGVAFGTGDDPDWHGTSQPLPSVGTPLEGTRVELRDPEAGTPAEPGAEGEIWVRSGSKMEGYFRDPDATEAALVRGWLRTGDLGVIDRGKLYVTGRHKELVVKAGRKLRPDEIEALVRDALDQEPTGVAALSLRGTETESLALLIESRDHLDERAARQVRGRVQEALGIRADTVRFLRPGSLPRTSSGKIRRFACANLVEADG